MLSKTIRKNGCEDKDYKSLKEEIKKDKDLEEYMMTVEDSEQNLYGDVVDVYMDENDNDAVVEYKVKYGGRTIKIEQNFQLPESNTDSYDIVKLLRQLYGENIGLHQGIERLKREDKLPVDLDGNSINGVEINYDSETKTNEESITQKYLIISTYVFLITIMFILMITT